MQIGSRIPAYSSLDSPVARHIAISVFLALLLHAIVLLAFYMRPSNTAPATRTTLDISFEVSQPDSPAQAEKRPTPPQTPPPPEESPAVTPPVPQVAEAQPQATPPQPAPPSVAAPNNPPPDEEAQPLFRLTRIPSFKKRLEAAYPASERRAGIQAYVLTEVTIDVQGNVVDVRILTSAGSAFDTAVMDALKKSVFSPGYIGDKAVRVRVQIPYRFSLN
ncbi:MAG: energy transducer TonB [Gallionellaceae bacterium]|nr:MAG: energy transducer TonB [Gallionellaceae bacterium]